ncbi:HAMP domain-containing histidine kinase [bacterium]|nr:HAMP domain-containing histidine kinase [bacterium]
MKLKSKFSFLATLLVVFIISGVSICWFIAERRYMINQLKENQVSLVDGLVQVSKEYLITKDQILLLNYINFLVHNKKIVYVIFSGVDGKILAHTDIHRLGETDKTIVGIKAIKTEKLFIQSYQNKKGKVITDYALPVFMERKKSGIARIGFSREELNKAIKETVFQTGKRIFGITLVGLIIGILGSLILAQTLTRPIKKLTSGAKMIGKGKLDTIIEVNNKDELGALAKEFNLMAFQLKELDQMKQDFVSSVTHELRSPLTSIMMYIDLFFKGATGELTEKQRNFLNIMKNSSKRLNSFINDLLDIAKIERGKMELIKEPLNMTTILQETIQLFNIQADEKNIKIYSKIQENIPVISADQNKIRQILNNLLSNAIKFTPEKGIISIEIQNISEYLQVSISDNGMGVPPEDLEKIFDKFKQVRGVKNKIKGHKGTGLGLATVKAIVQLHRGEIWVESILGKGSTFYFTLPKVK